MVMNVEQWDRLGQIIHRVISKQGKPQGYLRLLKLLYMIDRKSLERYYYTLTGDNYKTEDKGPILVSTKIELQKPNLTRGPLKQYLVKSAKNALIKVTKKEIEYDELSEAELHLIDGIMRATKNVSTNDLIDKTHEYGEFKKAHNSDHCISIEDIAKEVAKNDKEMRYIIEGQAAHQHLMSI